MNKIITLLIILIELPLWSQIASDQKSNPDFKGTEMAPLTVANLQGVWKEKNRKRFDLASDLPYETELSYRHIYIEGDKIWEFEYPIQMYSMRTYVIEDSVIKITSEKRFKKRTEKEMLIKLGTSGKCRYGVTADKKYLCFDGDNYFKDSLDLTVVEKLKNGKFNPDCLIGKWVLKTEFKAGYDGHGDQQIIYPWTLPRELNITKKNLYYFYGYRYLYLKINGEKQPFNIDEIHFTYYDGTLHLTPRAWHKKNNDENKSEDYSKVFTSIVRYEMYSD